MTRPRLLAFNAFSMLIANIVSKIVLLFGMIAFLQYLPPNLESIYYLITAMVLIITSNFQDGMVSITIQRAASDIENGAKHVGNLYSASTMLAAVLLVISVIASIIYANTQLVGTGARSDFILSALLLTAAILVGYWGVSAGAGFKAHEKLYMEAPLLVFQSILNAGVYIVGASNGWALPNFFLGLLVTNLIYSIIATAVLSKYIGTPKFAFNFHEPWDLFKNSLGLGYATLLRILQDRMHPFFITQFISVGLVTQFSSPNNLMLNFKFIPMSVRPAIFPTLVREAEKKTQSFQKNATALMKSLYLVAIPLVTLVIIARNEVLPFFTTTGSEFKEQYAIALTVLPFVAWAVAISFPSQVLRSLFVALKKPQFEFRTVLAGVIVLAILNVILIPTIEHYHETGLTVYSGVLGAAIGALLCELIIFLYGLRLLVTVGRGLNVVNLFLLPTLCGIITNWLAEYLYGYHWAMGIASVLVVFPILVLVFRVVSPEEWAILREVIKPSRPQAGKP